MALTRLTLKIEKLASDGAGLAHNDGKVCFVPWAVPGDTVVVQVEKDRKDFNECRILEIVEKSQDRADPPCPYFFKCGGCQLQHMNYSAQIRLKKAIVEDTLKRIAHIRNPCVEDVMPSPKTWNYRNRIRLHGDSSGRVGFYKNRSHEIVEIESCSIADERINEKLKNPEERIRPEASVAVDESQTFSQVNPEQNRNLVELVNRFASATKDNTVFDLFCGHGNLTLPLAGTAKTVYGMEKNPVAVEEGKRKAVSEGISNILWVQGTVFKTLLELKNRNTTCDVMVADPPRRGIAEALEGMLKFSPKRIVYVSCDPATFARDAARLIGSGYKLSRCQPLDMFPQTAHIEVLGLFEC